METSCEQPTVVEILPSYYFSAAVVIVLSCGHRHVRAVGWPARIGDLFACCFCDPLL